MLSGIYPPIAGSVRFDGKEIRSASPMHIVELGLVRDDAAVREDRILQLLIAWGGLIRRVVAMAHRELAEPGRDAIVAERIAPVREAIFVELRAREIRAETLRALERVFAQAESELGIRGPG